ncbi:transposase [Nonomuraea sp. B12E4]|uniref:IS701 family transposase n=1 Tax=Nonomuraea sp. B12E4 TaxID=3153564 RepID=UPI00325C48F4
MERQGARGLQALTDRLAGPLFTRPEPRAVFRDLVRALLSDVPRENSWQLSDHIGHPTANRFEHLLARAKWDPDRLRDEVRRYVVDHLAHPGAVLIADDTAALKRGDQSAGVTRQYCGRTGQVENCQAMPMLTHASPAGHTFINRRLYLPETWTGDPAHRARAHIPDQIAFATNPQLVITMLQEE